MHRILFHLGPFTVYSYGFMLALAFVLGTVLAQVRARRRKVSADVITDLVFVILVSSIVGARVFYVAVNRQYYISDPLSVIKVWEGGLVFYGGFIAAFFSAIWFIRKNGLPVGLIADIMAPSIALGIALGRIGCFLNGCCYGVLSRRWGIAFPCADMPPVCAQQIVDGLIAPGAAYSLAVLPTQIYSALFACAVFIVLLWIERYKRFDGFLFWMFVLLYGAGRFVIEAFRYYDQSYMIGHLTVSQAVSAVLFIVAAAILFTRSKHA